MRTGTTGRMCGRGRLCMLRRWSCVYMRLWVSIKLSISIHEFNVLRSCIVRNKGLGRATTWSWAITV